MFSVSSFSDRRSYTTAPGQERVFRMRFYLATNLFESKRQYIVYDGSSFIADVGGFLGLLLGHSVYGLVGQAAKVFSRLWTKRAGRRLEKV